MKIKTIVIVSVALAMVSCSSRGKNRQGGEECCTPHYAKQFAVCATDGASTVIEVRNPWQGAEGVTKRIFVARDGELPPDGFEGAIITSDPKRVVCFSSSHIAFLDALGLTDRIVGVSSGDYISNPIIAERYRNGSIREVGYDSNINYEVMIALHPDAVFIYGTNGENTSSTRKLNELGIQTVYVSDYLEEHPLGKSEWMRFFGEIFDRQIEAEEIFEGIAERYENIRIDALRHADRPSVIFNAPYRDVWFAPADDSYMVRLVEDAGGSYVCRGTAGNRSRPLAAESAYLYASKADIWLNPNSARTMEHLKAENPKYTDIPSVRRGRVYNCTARRTAGGGSDLWESGALRADLVLADIAAIVHPDDSVVSKLYYFEQLK